MKRVILGYDGGAPIFGRMPQDVPVPDWISLGYRAPPALPASKTVPVQIPAAESQTGPSKGGLTPAGLAAQRELQERHRPPPPPMPMALGEAAEPPPDYVPTYAASTREPIPKAPSVPQDLASENTEENRNNISDGANV